MSTASPVEVIRAIKVSHDRIMTWTGVAIGIVLLGYFFTFAQLIDRGYVGIAWFQALTSVALVIGLFTLKRLAFVMLRLLHGRRASFRAVLGAMSVADLDTDEETLSKRFASAEADPGRAPPTVPRG